MTSRWGCPRRWAAVAMVALLAAAGALPAAAQGTGAGGIGVGWSVAASADGTVLRWRPPGDLPVRDARLEFRAGEVLLGYPSLRGDAWELVVDQPVDPATVSVWLGAQRLDGPTPERRIASAADPAAFTRARPPVHPVDPGAPGRFDTESFSYDLEPLPFGRYPAPMEVVGDVIAPVDAPGARPLVLFIHGRHATCYAGGPDGIETLEWPCPDGLDAIPSHLGYRYAAELLASQGYVTVSISANAINAQDGLNVDGGAEARSVLIRHHLGLWAEWSAAGGDPWDDRFEGGVDMDRVVLVGHSRGGEGVERTAVDSGRRDPWRIRGLVPIGPTSFGRQVPAGIATAVILPYCDGDVSDLQGQAYVDNSRDLLTDDDRALRSSVLILGANHNYFNTEWTPGQAAAPAQDDWSFSGSDDDPVCGANGPGRLTPRQQQAAGATYIAALVQVAADRRAEVLPLLDGTAVRAASAGRATVLTHALGARRELLVAPDADTRLSTNNVAARVCRGNLPGELGIVSECSPAFGLDRMPHWLPMNGTESLPSPTALEVAWTRPGGNARAALDAPSDLSDLGVVELRVAVDPAVGRARFAVRLVDADGAVARLPGTAALEALPGDRAPIGKLWAQAVRFPLAGVGGVDLSAIVAIDIVAVSDTGTVWVIDAHQRRPGLPRTGAVTLPQFSVSSRRVAEGDDGPRTVRLPLRVRGVVRAPAVLWAHVISPSGAESEGFEIVVRPGASRPPAIPIVVDGDDQFSDTFGRYIVIIAAREGATSGRYIGGLKVLEDDDPPEITLSADPVTEGGTARIVASLSEPFAEGYFFGLNFVDPAGGAVLDTDDIDPNWLTGWTGAPPPVPPVPWADAFSGFIDFAPGQTEASFEVVIADDGIAEGTETVDVQVQSFGTPLSPDPIVTTIEVNDP